MDNDLNGRIFVASRMGLGERLAVFLASLVPSGIALVLVWAAARYRHGIFDVSPAAAAVLAAAFFASVWMAQMVYAQLLESDRDVTDQARRWWALSFVFAGPITLPFYWWAHVRGVPRALRTAPSTR